VTRFIIEKGISYWPVYYGTKIRVGSEEKAIKTVIFTAVDRLEYPEMMFFGIGLKQPLKIIRKAGMYLNFLVTTER